MVTHFINRSISLLSLLSNLTEETPHCFVSRPKIFWPLSSADSPLLCSGFARKIILCSGISTLFFGGITKLLNGGLSWLNGLSLAYYVSSEENGKSMILKQIFRRWRWFSLILSVASVALELGSLAAVFLPLSRPFLFLSAAGLHFGIWLTMWPNYFPQTFCYLFALNWQEIRIDSYSMDIYDNLNNSLSVASWSATLVFIFLTVATLLRIEYWPVTGIPMYSFYRDDSFDYKYLQDSAQAQLVSLEHNKSQYPYALAWSNLWIVLRLKNTDPAINAEHKLNKIKEQQDGIIQAPKSATSENRKGWSSEKLFVNLKKRATDPTAKHGVLTKQWRRILHNIAANDMAKKPWNAITHDQAAQIHPNIIYPAQQWLLENREKLRSYGWNLPSWSDKTGELQLRCKLKQGYAILAKIPWNSHNNTSTKNGLIVE
jgi:hypothetical protein